MARTYSEALRLLSSLQSNFAVTSMFKTKTAADGPNPDLNAQAIPEMIHWLQRAGYTPQDLIPLKTIHVAGTKGKGSVTAMCTSILLRYPVAGRVGTYTSPHLVTVRERIMLDGKPISQELFTRYFFELWDRFEAAAVEEGEEEEDVVGPGSKPFYFRYLTIMAWHVFLREGVKSVVMECGIGGEYDATNVIPAEAVTAAVVTQLGIDHVGMLGSTIEEIAWHKGGIFKKGVHGITLQSGRNNGVQAETALAMLEQRAWENGADLEVLQDGMESLPLVSAPELDGPFQTTNRIVATAAAREHLVRMGQEFYVDGMFGQVEGEHLQVPIEFAEGLEAAFLRGRGEVLKDGRTEWHLDGAHTKESLAGVAYWWFHNSNFTEYGEQVDATRCLLFNQQERDSEAVLGGLIEEIRRRGREDEVDSRILMEENRERGIEDESRPIATMFDLAVFSRNELSVPDGMPAGDLNVQLKNCHRLRLLDPKVLSVTQNSVQQSVDLIRNFARATATDEDQTFKVLVTGSFHLVGAVIRCIERNVEE